FDSLFNRQFPILMVRHPIKNTMLLFLALLTAQLVAAQHSTTPTDIHGLLRTSGNRVVNQYGVPPQLRGMSFSWSIWEGQKYYNEAVVDWLVDDFRVSLIRLSMA